MGPINDGRSAARAFKEKAAASAGGIRKPPYWRNAITGQIVWSAVSPGNDYQLYKDDLPDVNVYGSRLPAVERGLIVANLPKKRTLMPGQTDGGELMDVVTFELAMAFSPTPFGKINLARRGYKLLQQSLNFVGKLFIRTKATKTSSIFSQITPKIVKQMGRRGWTKELIHETVNNPFTTRVASNKATGNAATAYFQKNGSYIVKDNITNEVIQISNRLDSKWVPDATIINPYIPK
ncbi:MAG: hypothetical protein HC913_05475 [Microscillaceae bacterium]|nr:hypothetical protein [Microscillaceae bacterium]